MAWQDYPCDVSWRCKDIHGYPVMKVGGRQGKVVHESRIVLAKKLGRPLKEKHQALHHCDNPGCIEPEHLWEGTQKQNLADARAKGRKTSWSWGSRR